MSVSSNLGLFHKFSQIFIPKQYKTAFRSQLMISQPFAGQNKQHTDLSCRQKVQYLGHGHDLKIRLPIVLTEARWHIGMSSASHREDPGSNPGKGQFFRIKMKNVTFELLR